jgi:hypothetical protein
MTTVCTTFPSVPVTTTFSAVVVQAGASAPAR